MPDYRYLIESLQDIVYCVSPKGLFTYINRAVQILGYKPEDLIGKHFRILMNPEDFLKVSRLDILPQYRGIVTGDENSPKLFDERRTKPRMTQDLELRLLKKQVGPGLGEYVIGELVSFGEFSVSGTCEEQGRGGAQLLGSVGIITDITKRKRSETELNRKHEHLENIIKSRTRELLDSKERFRSTFEQAPVGIAHISPEGKWMRVNNQFCKILGYSSNELQTLGFQDITYKEDIEKDLQHIRKLLSGEIRQYSMEKRYVRKDASLVWINLTVSLVRKDSGEPKYFIAVFEDISKRKNSEEEKQLLEGELRQIQKLEAIGNLVGGIAHDFNNLLMVIDGNINFALTASKNSQVREDLVEAQKATTRAKDLTRQLLVFSRKRPLQTSRFVLNGVIEGLLKMLNRLIGEDIRLITSLKDSLPEIDGDVSAIEQVILNLVVNSRDAMPDGGKITISTEKEKSAAGDFLQEENHEDGCVLLSVKDSGVGMSPDVLDHIFEPFFTTKDVGKGTGLGLSVVYGIVKQHKGRIEVKSKPESGTVFHIYFPKAKSAEKETVVQKIDGNGPVRGKGEKILLVEDEDAVRVLTERGLRENGYSVISADSAEQAFALFDKHNRDFDLVFSDIILPDIKGTVMVKQLLKMKPDLKVLFVSGYSDGKSEGQFIRENHFTLIQKPFRFSDLFQVLHQLLS